jgi:hypothetical protein
VIAAFVAGAGAGAVSAATFYVNERSGNDSNTCKGRAPTEVCLTIHAAVTKAEAVTGPNTIEVAEGEYKETKSIELAKTTDAGLTINGEEPGVRFSTNGIRAVTVGAAAGAITLSHLGIVTNGAAAVRDEGAELTLANDTIEDESGVNGVEAASHGSLTILNTEINMESGSTGFAVRAKETPLTLNGDTILEGSQSAAEAGGVTSEKSTLAMTNTTVDVETGLGPVLFGVAAGRDTSASLTNVAVRQNTSGPGVVLEKTPTNIGGLRVEMLNESSTAPAVLDESETPGISSTLSGLAVSGEWKGAGVLADGEQITLSDSRVKLDASSESPAIRYVGGGAGLVVQRSILQSAPGANPGALVVIDGNATTDSSEILGGKDGVFDETTEAATRSLTLSASTVDAGAPGIAGDAAGVTGVETVAKGGPGRIANVSIQGSIVLETQTASAAAGDQVTVNCGYSALPSQSQAGGGGVGAIACAAGSAGNTEVNPLSALLAEPFGNYQLNPSSSAVDSVPAGAIALPFGLTPSPTDLAGNPRVVDGNGDCTAVQDKGALELQGHAAACPTPPVAKITTPPTKPIVGVLSALTISPSAFLAAPKGATISRAKKKKYGAKITYRDSQAGTTTFTVLLPSVGRRQGRSCKRPGKANRRGKRCTIYKALGSFTHTDTAGANSLHFSGRLNGKRLPKGSYRLQAVPHDAAGNGAAVSVKFTIKK